MNLHDQVIYRCIHAACARGLPRKVNFCPYCGTGQHDGVTNPAHIARPAQAQYHEAEPVQPKPPAPPAVPPAPLQAAAPVPAASQALVPPAATAPPKASAAAGRGTAASPPRREPVRLRWWLVALATLWVIWLYARPAPDKVAQHIKNAREAMAECRLDDAGSEFNALLVTKATKKQRDELQQEIRKATTRCEKKEGRVTSWKNTVAAVQALLEAEDFAGAQNRLAEFTGRWNEDPDTRALKQRIAAQKKAAGPPIFERPVRTTDNRAQSVRNLIDEAERALARGDYEAASNTLETCIAMVDADTGDCKSYKVHADSMVEARRLCIGDGLVWAQDRCRR